MQLANLLEHGLELRILDGHDRRTVARTGTPRGGFADCLDDVVEIVEG
jgi:hypothetical protein